LISGISCILWTQYSDCRILLKLRLIATLSQSKPDSEHSIGLYTPDSWKSQLILKKGGWHSKKWRYHGHRITESVMPIVNQALVSAFPK
jgi:hypothetical protein